MSGVMLLIDHKLREDLHCVSQILFKMSWT